MVKKTGISIPLISGLFALFILFSGCQSNNDDVVYSSIALKCGEGLDFSSEQIIIPDSQGDSLEFVNTVDDIDLVIEGLYTIPEAESAFGIYGSPTPIFFSTFGIKIIGSDDANPSLLRLNEENLNAVSEVPLSGYTVTMESSNNEYSNRVEEGAIIAVKTQDGKYAVIEVVDIDIIEGNFTIELNYKYQPDGSRFFE